MPDGLYKDCSFIRDAVLRTVHHRCQLRVEHLVGSHVHIGDSAIESERWPGHGEPARCYGGPPNLSGPGRRTDSWDRRRLAGITRTSYLPCHSTVGAASNLPGIPEVSPADVSLFPLTLYNISKRQ